NCLGGTSVGTLNYGVNFQAPLTMVSGSLQFNNCVGGGSSSSSLNYGVIINNVAVAAPSIITNDVLGGVGSSSHGFYVSGSSAVVGNTSTQRLAIVAGALSGGTTTNGINVTSGTLTVGNAGSIILNGTG